MPTDSFWPLDLTVADFAERLRTLRTQRKLTQTRLAELLDVSPRVYNRWEKSEVTPHFDTVVKIADLLQVSLDELAGRQEVTSEPVVHDHRLHSLWQQVDRLSDEDQRALTILLESLVKRAKFERVMQE